MKTTVQTNLSLLERLVKVLPNDLDSARNLLADTFVWHYFNPALPEIAGDYNGLQGLRAFFEKLSTITQDTFEVKIHQVIPVGEELVVVHANPSMTFAGDSFDPGDLQAVSALLTFKTIAVMSSRWRAARTGSTRCAASSTRRRVT